MATYIVGCRGLVQLGGTDPWYNQGGPAKVGARKLFLFTKSSFVVKIKNIHGTIRITDKGMGVRQSFL